MTDAEKARKIRAVYEYAKQNKNGDRLTQTDIKNAKEATKMNKGGGMDMGAKKSKMLNFKSDKERKDYTKQAIASLEGITESFKDKLNPMKAQRLLDRLPKKKIKKVKARFGDFMNTFIADDTRSVAGKSGGADSGTAGEMRSKLGKSDVVEKKKIKNYIKKKVEQTKTVIKKTKEAAKKTGTILATPIKKFHELAEENVRKNGPVRIYKPRTMNKGGGMDMGKKEEPTQWITKKEKPTQWITKKEEPTQWITKKEKPKKWITKKSRGGGMDMGQMPNTVKPRPRGNPGIVETVVGKGGDYIKDLID